MHQGVEGVCTHLRQQEPCLRRSGRRVHLQHILIGMCGLYDPLKGVFVRTTIGQIKQRFESLILEEA